MAPIAVARLGRQLSSDGTSEELIIPRTDHVKPLAMLTVHPFRVSDKSCYNHSVNESAGDRVAPHIRLELSSLRGTGFEHALRSRAGATP
jgi:hypothetical protein